MIIFNISWNQKKVSWCIIENDHNFERTENRATVSLKWTVFSRFVIEVIQLKIRLCQTKKPSSNGQISKFQVHYVLCVTLTEEYLWSSRLRWKMGWRRCQNLILAVLAKRTPRILSSQWIPNVVPLLNPNRTLLRVPKFVQYLVCSLKRSLQ